MLDRSILINSKRTQVMLGRFETANLARKEVDAYVPDKRHRIVGHNIERLKINDQPNWLATIIIERLY